MNVVQTNVLDVFVGGQVKAPSPNIQGTAISENMITETNGEIKYLRSLYGKKFYRNIEESVVTSETSSLTSSLTSETSSLNCTGSFYASVGLDAENRLPSSFWCFGDNLYEVRPSGGVNLLLTSAMDKDYGWSFVESGGERPFLLICNGNTLHAYNLYTGELKIVEMPLGITGDTIVPGSVSCLAGSIIVNDKNTGYAYYSQPYVLSKDTIELLDKDNDGNIIYIDDTTPSYSEKSVWEGNIFYDMYGTLQYKNAESSSDKIVMLKSVGDVLTVYGSSSIEFWTRSDAEGMTWQRTNYTANSSLGLKNARSVGVFNNVQGFIGSGNRSGLGVYVINGTQIDKISPTWLDELLFGSVLNQVFGYGYSYGNHSFYCVHFKDKDSRFRCFAFDMISGDWHERSSVNTIDLKLESTHYVYPIFNREGKLLYGSFSTNKNACLFEARNDYWYEDTDATHKVSFVRSRQTPIIMEGEREFILNALSIEGNFGNSLVRDEQPQCMLEISRDGGYTYGNTLVRDLPNTGEYRRRVLWNGLGIVRNCVIKFSVSSPIDLMLQNASIATVSLSYRL